MANGAKKIARAEIDIAANREIRIRLPMGKAAFVECVACFYREGARSQYLFPIATDVRTCDFYQNSLARDSQISIRGLCCEQ